MSDNDSSTPLTPTSTPTSSTRSTIAPERDKQVPQLSDKSNSYSWRNWFKNNQENLKTRFYYLVGAGIVATGSWLLYNKYRGSSDE